MWKWQLDKMDEMEKDICIKSMVTAHRFVCLVLVAGSGIALLVGWYLTCTTLLAVAWGELMVREVARLVYRKRVGDKPAIREILLLAVGIAGMILVIVQRFLLASQL